MANIDKKDPSAVALGRRGGQKGGRARAEKLSPEQRKAIGRRGAEARWAAAAQALRSNDVPKAIAEGEIKISDGIACAVLEDGRRVLSRRGVGAALGRKHGGASLQAGAELPFFLSADYLKPFVSDELKLVLSQPIMYRGSGGVTYGVPAETLPQIFDVWLQARDARVLTSPQQKQIAETAYMLMRGLAGVAMVALVDEATGYQDYRDRNALALILEKFIAKELQPYLSTFEPAFYKEIFRLRGWQFNPLSVKRPGVLARYTTDIVYKRLAPNVLDELKKLTKKHKDENDLKRRPHLHRALTRDIGHPKLKEHLAVVTALAQISPTWSNFMTAIDRVRPRFGDTYLMRFPDSAYNNDADSDETEENRTAE